MSKNPKGRHSTTAPLSATVTLRVGVSRELLISKTTTVTGRIQVHIKYVYQICVIFFSLTECNPLQLICKQMYYITLRKGDTFSHVSPKCDFWIFTTSRILHIYYNIFDASRCWNCLLYFLQCLSSILLSVMLKITNNEHDYHIKEGHNQEYISVIIIMCIDLYYTCGLNIK